MVEGNDGFQGGNKEAILSFSPAENSQVAYKDNLVRPPVILHLSRTLTLLADENLVMKTAAIGGRGSPFPYRVHIGTWASNGTFPVGLELQEFVWPWQAKKR